MSLKNTPRDGTLQQSLNAPSGSTAKMAILSPLLVTRKNFLFPALLTAPEKFFAAVAPLRRVEMVLPRSLLPLRQANAATVLLSSLATKIRLPQAKKSDTVDLNPAAEMTFSTSAETGAMILLNSLLVVKSRSGLNPVQKIAVAVVLIFAMEILPRTPATSNAILRSNLIIVRKRYHKKVFTLSPHHLPISGIKRKKKGSLPLPSNCF